MKRVACFLVVLGLWLLLFWSIDWTILATGLALALAVSVFMGSVYPNRIDKMLHVKRWLFFLIYVPYFLYFCIRANLDVAIRVLHPDVPIRPGIVKVRTTLRSEMARTFLANSITLTPGTLTVDVDGQDLYVHWINIDTDDVQERTAEICGRFEPLLRRVFE